MIFRPATPGFLVTLIATILLAVVSFSVPWFKSVYFLKATVNLNGQDGVVTFGVLGYCLDTGEKASCSNPQLGYQFDPNALLDNKTPIKIPEVLVKWLTYALVLHIVALALAAGSALFGLLAHIREMAMTCCSTCISGFGAVVTLLAFVFDVAFFFLVKARINKIPGGSAQIGNGIWLTLAAWVLLFLAGFFYGFGRCCLSSRPRGPRDKKMDSPFTGNGTDNMKAEAMRLDAVKAEVDRKARQKQGETGLPAFHEYDPTRPLTAKGYEDEEEVYTPPPQPPRRQANGYSDNQYAPQSHSGYTPAVPGTSAMEAYYNTPAQPTTQVPPPAAAYPPPPQLHTQYPSSQYSAYGNPEPTNEQYLSPTSAYAHSQYPSNATQETNYGHSGQESSYYSAASHYQQPTHYTEPSYNNASSGNSGAYVPSSNAGGNTPAYQVPMANFTATGAPGSMGRDDYSFSKTPQPPQPVGAAADTSYLAFTGAPAGPSHDQNLAPRPVGPRSPASPPTLSNYSHPYGHENPPGYDAGDSKLATTWPNEKR